MENIGLYGSFSKYNRNSKTRRVKDIVKIGIVFQFYGGRYHAIHYTNNKLNGTPKKEHFLKEPVLKQIVLKKFYYF